MCADLSIASVKSRSEKARTPELESKLKGEKGDALFISEGLGHAFIALEDNTNIAYLLTSPYSPADEFEIHPLDPDLAIAWPIANLPLSTKDAAAPSFKELSESRKF